MDEKGSDLTLELSILVYSSYWDLPDIWNNDEEEEQELICNVCGFVYIGTPGQHCEEDRELYRSLSYDQGEASREGEIGQTEYPTWGTKD